MIWKDMREMVFSCCNPHTTSYICKSVCKYFVQMFLSFMLLLSLYHSSPAEPSWEQSWHHINTVQSSCHSLGLHKRLISQNVWQEENMLPSRTPTSLHFPIPLVFFRDADTVSLRSVFEGRQQRPVWPDCAGTGFIIRFYLLGFQSCFVEEAVSLGCRQTHKQHCCAL